jgi:hypothetical protein
MVRVVAPAGALGAGVTVNVNLTPAPKTATPGARLVSEVFQVELSNGAQPRRPVRLELPYQPTGVAADDVLSAVSYDPAKGRWEAALVEKVDRSRHVVIVTTPHLSRWAVFDWPLEVLKQAALGTWNDILHNTIRAEPLKCHEPMARLLVAVRAHHASVSDPPVYACGDIVDQYGYVVRVVNNRSVGLSIELPNGVHDVRTDFGSFGDDIYSLLSELNDKLVGANEAYLPPRSTMLLTGFSPTSLLKTLTADTNPGGVMYDAMLQAVGAVAAKANLRFADKVKLSGILAAEGTVAKLLGDIRNRDAKGMALDIVNALFENSPMWKLTMGLVMGAFATVVSVGEAITGVFARTGSADLYALTYSGQWYAHGSHMAIDHLGHGRISYRAYQWCPGTAYFNPSTYDPKRPCDGNATNPLTDGGHASFQLKALNMTTSSDKLVIGTATVLSTNDPTTYPGTFRLELWSNGYMTEVQGKSPPWWRMSLSPASPSYNDPLHQIGP